MTAPNGNKMVGSNPVKAVKTGYFHGDPYLDMVGAMAEKTSAHDGGETPKIRAASSAVEHCVDIAVAAGSIPAPPTNLIPYDIEVALRCAEILGPSSAPALALCELKRRVDAGEDVALFTSGGTIVVGPRVNRGKIHMNDSDKATGSAQTFTNDDLTGALRGKTFSSAHLTPESTPEEYSNFIDQIEKMLSSRDTHA